MSRLIFLTGRPGIGKTSVLLQTIELLRAQGFTTGGMISRESRDRGIRIGFEIVDLETGRKGWLAHTNQPTGPRVGKYRVNLGDLNTIGAGSILRAVKKADVVVIDEVGPMELSSEAFKEAVTQALSSGEPVLGTIHYWARDPLVVAIKKRKDAKIIEVTRENRDKLAEPIAQGISETQGKS